MTAVSPQVGQLVQYLGHENIPMAATVIMTAGTYNAERDQAGAYAPADATSVSLKITRPVSGREYVRHNVPLDGSLAHAVLLEAVADWADNAATGQADAGDVDEDGEYSAATPRPVARSWKPVQ